MSKNLTELLMKSSSTRSYFVSLPIWLQLLLHKEHEYIHNASQLHLTADILIKQNKLYRKD